MPSYFETVAKLNALAEVTDALATMCSLYHLLKISIGFFDDTFILCRPLFSCKDSACKQIIIVYVI